MAGHEDEWLFIYLFTCLFVYLLCKSYSKYNDKKKRKNTCIVDSDDLMIVYYTELQAYVMLWLTR